MNKDRRMVYVAGAMSNSSPLLFLQNVRKGLDLTRRLIEKGVSPFSPFLDLQLFLAENTVSLDDVQRIGIDFMVVCDAVVLVYNGKNSISKGLGAELTIAMDNNIPIFESADQYLRWAKGEEIKSTREVKWSTGTFRISSLSLKQEELAV